MSHTQDLSVPVIAIDGGAGTGKGSARSIVARTLGFRELDSGLLYRAVGLLLKETGHASQLGVIRIASELNFRVEGETCFLNDVDRTQDLRSDIAGKLASQVSQIPEVRSALLAFQYMMRCAPGLVADGRDQGTVFAGSYTYFLVANSFVKAQRRRFQLEQLGIPHNPDDVHAEIVRRDHADMNRAVSPLVPLEGAVVIDTSLLSREEVATIILRDYRQRSGS